VLRRWRLAREAGASAFTREISLTAISGSFSVLNESDVGQRLFTTRELKVDFLTGLRLLLKPVWLDLADGIDRDAAVERPDCTELHEKKPESNLLRVNVGRVSFSTFSSHLPD
jgi:hypothetical protein